jgi:hypothetical protein
VGVGERLARASGPTRHGSRLIFPRESPSLRLAQAGVAPPWRGALWRRNVEREGSVG